MLDKKFYNSNLTSNVRRANESVKNSNKKLKRDFSPVRGFLNLYVNYKDDIKEVNRDLSAINQQLGKLNAQLIRFIKDKVKDQKTRQSLITWEKFQMSQKGPTGPLPVDPVSSIIIPDIIEETLPFDSSLKKEVDGAFSILNDHYSFSQRAENIKFDEEGNKLPSSTKRGFPYLQKGVNVDKEIIKKGGRTLRSAFKYFSENRSLTCYPGGRIQGKHEPPAKLRVIFMPDVNFQYLMNGIINASMNQLKAFPSFCGWLEPKLRDDVIKKMLLEMDQQGGTSIPIDFSKFDKHIHPYFREKCAEWLHNRFPDLPSNFASTLKEKYNNQVCLLPSADGLKGFNLPNQLLSGMKNTQHDGNLINLALQALIAKQLGYPFKPEGSLALGDDTALAVPKSVLEQFGYKGFLTKVKQAVGKFHFIVHDVKSYPTPELIFLQRLYSPSAKLFSQGTWARNLASFFYPEKFSEKIRGIKSIPALHIISQVSILSQAYSGSVMDDFGQIVANWGANHDDLLAALLGHAKKKKLNENQFFDMLIKATTQDKQVILEALGIQSYDHKGIASSLINGQDYRLVFPILTHLLRVKLNSAPNQAMVSKLLEDYQEFQEDFELEEE